MSNKRSAISLTDLPSNVLVEILARLSLRTLFVARSVCKTFTLLTNPNPHFINLHSSNAPQLLVFQFQRLTIPSYLLRLAEIDYNSKLKPMFQLPKMPPFTPREPCSFFLINSCNGLLYFLSRGLDRSSVVCNPVTNEYIPIPEVDGLDTVTMSMWLGFSPCTDQYKVLRIFCLRRHGEAFAQVSVIGSDSRRYIDDTPMRMPHLNRDLPVSLVNGVMYWHHPHWSDLLSFDFEGEKFREVALPVKLQKGRTMSIGVLGSCLCLSCNHFVGHCVDLWVMGKCGSWKKQFVIDIVRPCYSQFRSLQFLQNGDILMVLVGYGLVRFDPRKGTLRTLGLNRMVKLDYRVVALTPSFVPLKETLKVERVLSGLRPRGDEKEEL